LLVLALDPLALLLTPGRLGGSGAFAGLCPALIRGGIFVCMRPVLFATPGKAALPRRGTQYKRAAGLKTAVKSLAVT
jgi:hypothetical protein